MGRRHGSAQFKSLTAAPCGTGRPFGESFEISADDGDDEARLHPSVLALADGSTITLPALLAVHADALLGEAFVQRYGRRFPLLPKLLDVAELLSVQAHPPGNTEVYVIVDAEPGATIRLGFAVDVDAGIWTAEARRRPARSAAVARAARRGLGGRAAGAAQGLARAPHGASRRSSKRRCARGSLAAAAWTEVEGAAHDVARHVLGRARLVERDSREGRRRRLQRESGAYRGGERQAASRRRCTRSAIPRAAACSRSRSAARARRCARGTTCVFRCVTSTSTERSRR